MKELVYHRALLPAASRYADRPLSIDGDLRTTFAEHLDRVCRLAHALRHQLGVQKGDRYAVMALNGHAFLELYHAGFLGAGVINPLNLRLAPMELEFILRDSGTKVCFADAFFAPAIERVRAAVGIETVVLMGPHADVPHDAVYEDLVAAGRPDVPEEPEEDDPVILMYTGGTTGTPKGVLIDSRAAVLDMYKIGVSFPFEEGHVYLHQTPMFHAASFGGVLTIPTVGGASTYVGLFDPAAVLDTIERERVTTTVMVPTMIQLLLDHPAYRPERLASMRFLSYGASPMPTALLERLLTDLPGVDLYQGYGMTESSGLLTVLGPAEHRQGGELLRSAGRPLVGTSLSVRSPTGTELAPGEVGEIWARAGNFMREYWHRPAETAAAFADGWYHTGDAGRIDEHGYLYLVDRVKDMIVSGGENVYSAEVENALASHPAVAQVAVIGIPSDQWGEAVHAIVVLKPGAAATEKELQDWARERIAGFKVPKSVEFRAEPLPLSGALKVLKRDLRAAYWEGTDRAVN
jgi:long-chain acyl-CoA synthetase